MFDPRIHTLKLRTMWTLPTETRVEVDLHDPRTHSNLNFVFYLLRDSRDEQLPAPFAYVSRATGFRLHRGCSGQVESWSVSFA